MTLRPQSTHNHHLVDQLRITCFLERYHDIKNFQGGVQKERAKKDSVPGGGNLTYNFIRNVNKFIWVGPRREITLIF